MRPFLLFAVVFAQYVVIAANYRAVAFQKYWAIAATDLGIGAMSFMAVKLVAESQGAFDVAGYSIGGMLGGVAGTWATKHWGGK